MRAASSWTGPWPIVSIWHGDADFVVRPANLTESMQQWTDVHGIDQAADVVDTVAGYPHRVYKDASGAPRVETYSITGMGHGTPVDPGTGATQCGTTGAYILDANICSSFYIGRFFGLDGARGSAPTVALTAPAAGATVAGTVTVAATASDDTGVERVDFLLDGALLGSDATAPYAIAWNTADTGDGARTLSARALDMAGNNGSSAGVGIVVANGSGGGSLETAVFANEDANDGYVKATASGGSAATGTLEGVYGLAIGRGSDGKYNRSVLSFDTSALPEGAQIVSATLTVRYRSASGDPWNSPAGNSLVVDARRGCFGPCAIDIGDWSAAASAPAVASIPAFASGSQSSTPFASAGLAAIDTAGRTQFRLRFAADQTATHYLWIDRGATATLSVTYRR